MDAKEIIKITRESGHCEFSPSFFLRTSSNMFAALTGGKVSDYEYQDEKYGLRLWITFGQDKIVCMVDDEVSLEEFRTQHLSRALARWLPDFTRGMK